MIDTDEKVDARTVEEDMETRNNMTWLNYRVVELETEVKRLRGLTSILLSVVECNTRMSDTVKLKSLINDLRSYVLREGDEEE